MFSRFFSKKTPRRSKTISYDDAKALARDGDEVSRAELAQRGDVAPEILYFLAEDPSPKVRRSLASNEAAPRRADLILAQDKDEAVRGSLAEKIVRLAPGVGPDEHDRLRNMTYEALSLLAKDQAVKIRQILADALKEVADAPPDVIRRLAWDVEAAVATPVLRFSPVLTDDDLIEIIQARPSPGSVAAISQRADVSENVSDAIVDSDDEEAVALLLGNASAQIREETLDRVINMAVDVDLWHMPLAMRPKLPSSAAVKVARFVAEDILKQMVARDDLPQDAVKAVREVVHKRLGGAEAILGEDADGGVAGERGMRVDDDEIFDRTAKEWALGKIDEESVKRALKENDLVYAMAMIAVMADLPLRIVKTACRRSSAKGCVAVAWQARISAATAEEVQRKLGRIQPKDLLRAVDGEYPLTDDEMVWQIGFLRGL